MYSVYCIGILDINYDCPGYKSARCDWDDSLSVFDNVWKLSHFFICGRKQQMVDRTRGWPFDKSLLRVPSIMHWSALSTRHDPIKISRILMGLWTYQALWSFPDARVILLWPLFMTSSTNETKIHTKFVQLYQLSYHFFYKKKIRKFIRE